MTGGVEMTFERIDMEQWPRREHYRYYNEQIRTSYEMNVELDVTKLKGDSFLSGDDVCYYVQH